MKYDPLLYSKLNQQFKEMKKMYSTAATHNIAAECYCVNNNNHLL